MRLQARQQPQSLPASNAGKPKTKKSRTKNKTPKSFDLHWPRVVKELKNNDPFDRHFPSYRTGHHKPDLAAYKDVRAEFPGEELTFFDDNEQNVHAARTVGFKAFQVKEIDELRSTLLEILWVIK